MPLPHASNIPYTLMKIQLPQWYDIMEDMSTISSNVRTGFEYTLIIEGSKATTATQMVGVARATTAAVSSRFT